MKTFNPLSVVACAAFMMILSANPVAAQQGQGRGNIDPAEFRQRMMDNYRERLEIKGDDEWKAIQPLIEKVTEARREVGFGGGGFAFGRGGGGGRRGGGNGDAQANGNNQGGRRGFPGGEPSAEAEELQKAIDSNASKDELKAKLTKFREARKDKEAKLAKAQEDLKKVLSVKQEAAAVLMGLLQ